MTDKYESPLGTRYASDYMLELFSADRRYQTWRKLWAALAREEMALGCPSRRSRFPSWKPTSRTSTTTASGRGKGKCAMT